jgi:hypothetical protein
MGATTRRWRRYGHDRTYVADGEATLGYRDERTGVVHVMVAGRDAEVRAALAVPPVPSPPVLPVVTADLGERRAGTAARALAAQARAERPVLTRLARLVDGHTPERAWRRGAEGEERVEARLTKLPPAWRVRHDLSMGNGNVDHLVIGPGGVFSLNTKNLTGRVWVGAVVLHNGTRTDYVRNSRHEAEAVAKRLTRAAGRPVAVHGVLVILCNDLTVKAQPDGVMVLHRLGLLRWLKKRPVVLTPDDVQAVHRAACDPATWAPARR